MFLFAQETQVQLAIFFSGGEESRELELRYLTLSISKTAIPVLIPRCTDGESRVGAYARPVGVGAAALGFGGRETGLLCL